MPMPSTCGICGMTWDLLVDCMGNIKSNANVLRPLSQTQVGDVDEPGLP